MPYREPANINKTNRPTDLNIQEKFLVNELLKQKFVILRLKNVGEDISVVEFYSPESKTDYTVSFDTTNKTYNIVSIHFFPSGKNLILDGKYSDDFYKTFLNKIAFLEFGCKIAFSLKEKFNQFDFNKQNNVFVFAHNNFLPERIIVSPEKIRYNFATKDDSNIISGKFIYEHKLDFETTKLYFILKNKEYVLKLKKQNDLASYDGRYSVFSS